MTKWIEGQGGFINLDVVIRQETEGKVPATDWRIKVMFMKV